MDKRDIHNRERSLNACFKLIENSDISDYNKKKILDFGRICLLKITKDRTLFYLNKLNKIAKWLGKDFDKATKRDIENIAETVNKEDYSVWTKSGYKITLKLFYKWLLNCEYGYPDIVKWLNGTVSKREQQLPKEIMTQEEIKRMVSCAEHPVHKAIIRFLYDSGARVGEFLNIKLKDIQNDTNGIRVILNGKTGERRILLIGSVADYTLNWINSHPDKDNKEAYVWLNTQNYKPLEYIGLVKLLKRMSKKAGIKKPVNPHSFRHAKASHMAKYLTECQMNCYFGWVQGSDMPSVYVHLSGRDLDDSLLKMYGIKKEDETENIIDSAKCPRCSYVNRKEAKSCERCGMIFDIKTAMEAQELEKLEKKFAFKSREEMKEMIKELLKEEFSNKS